VLWNDPIDDGGCPVREFKVFRDMGKLSTETPSTIADVTTEVHSSSMAGKSYLNGLEITEFPTGSEGKRFTFAVKVFTDYASSGVVSPISDSLVLAGLPGAPDAAPTRNSLTSETVIAVDLTSISTTHYAAITSYQVLIDDGLGGSFTEWQGTSAPSMTLSP